MFSQKKKKKYIISRLSSTLKCGRFFLVRTTWSALFRHIPEAVGDLPDSPYHLYLKSKLPKKIYAVAALKICSRKNGFY